MAYITNEILKQQLAFTLSETDFDQLGVKYTGKIRDNYTNGDQRILVVTDKLSAFDRIITTIPFKGQVLNQMALFWFDLTKDICPNHLISSPDPNCVIAKQCEPIPVEMVVRGYITGSTGTSIWHNYNLGSRNFCGNELPDGLRKNQKLEQPIITPSTKAEKGDHDESVSKEELIKRGAVTEEDFNDMAQKALALYNKGVEHCAKHGIIFVDTKYEFGQAPNGEIILIDEIHTPDSSRFWLANNYLERFEQNEEPDNINKEFLRLWLANQGYTGEGPIPHIPDEIRIETAQKYIQAYEQITGLKLDVEIGDPLPRIKANLHI